MKLSELSYREYLAIEFVPAFMRHYAALGNSEDEIAENTAKFAFRYADAFLRIAGKENDRIARAEANALRLSSELDVVRSMLVNMGSDFAARAALTQIWEALGVTDQTSAMRVIRKVAP